MPIIYRVPRIKKICYYCKKLFEVRISSNRRFCSRACSDSSRVGKHNSEAFWKRVNFNGPIKEHCKERGPCWEQLSRTDNNQHRAPSRLAWEIVNGLIPEGLWVLHHCDNKLCVKATNNPKTSHLYLGTIVENTKDVALRIGFKGGAKNSPRGEDRYWNVKLTENQVRFLREQWKLSGLSAGSFAGKHAKEYGIGRTGMANMLVGKRWKHIE